MTIKKKSGRQDVLWARIEFGFADIDDTTFHGAVELPYGAIVVGGAVEVLGAAQATVTIGAGDSASNTRYKSGVDATALARTPLVPTGFKTTAEGDVGVKFNVKPTQGSFALEVQYVVEGRVAMSQGLDYRAPGIRGA